MHDDVGVIGRAGRAEVELLGGYVAVAVASLDFGGGSEQRLVSGPGTIQCLLERGGHEDAQVPPVNTPSKSSTASARAFVTGWDGAVSMR